MKPLQLPIVESLTFLELDPATSTHASLEVTSGSAILLTVKFWRATARGTEVSSQSCKVESLGEDGNYHATIHIQYSDDCEPASTKPSKRVAI